MPAETRTTGALRAKRAELRESAERLLLGESMRPWIEATDAAIARLLDA